jgi:drug/metabolite transporter (DMT)-like permease
MNWVMMFVQAIVYASALLVLRFSLPQFNKDGYSLTTLVWISLGALMTVASFALWLYILRTNSVSVAYPISVGASMILVSIGAWVFLDERISGIQTLGMVLLFVGVVLVSWGYKTT